MISKIARHLERHLLKKKIYNSNIAAHKTLLPVFKKFAYYYYRCNIILDNNFRYSTFDLLNIFENTHERQ